jgi:hypothetical protein
MARAPSQPVGEFCQAGRITGGKHDIRASIGEGARSGCANAT